MTTNLFDLTGKIGAVTSASRGIRESIEQLLAGQSALVIGSSRKICDFRAFADVIVGSGGDAAGYTTGECIVVDGGGAL